jgi:hypothetical protein
MAAYRHHSQDDPVFLLAFYAEEKGELDQVVPVVFRAQMRGLGLQLVDVQPLISVEIGLS